MVWFLAYGGLECFLSPSASARSIKLCYFDPAASPFNRQIIVSRLLGEAVIRQGSGAPCPGRHTGSRRAVSPSRQMARALRSLQRTEGRILFVSRRYVRNCRRRPKRKGGPLARDRRDGILTVWRQRGSQSKETGTPSAHCKSLDH